MRKSVIRASYLRQCNRWRWKIMVQQEGKKTRDPAQTNEDQDGGWRQETDSVEAGWFFEALLLVLMVLSGLLTEQKCWFWRYMQLYLYSWTKGTTPFDDLNPSGLVLAGSTCTGWIGGAPFAIGWNWRKIIDEDETGWNNLQGEDQGKTSCWDFGNYWWCDRVREKLHAGNMETILLVHVWKKFFLGKGFLYWRPGEDFLIGFWKLLVMWSCQGKLHAGNLETILLVHVWKKFFFRERILVLDSI